jgi:hypothetical protein
LVQKKIIKSLLYGNYDIISIYYARIYTAGKDSKFWLYSGLEGALVYCLDLRPRVLRFLLFNLKTYEIVFDCELYKKFSLAFKKGTDTFYYFGVNDGYIGFEIPDPKEAISLEEEISSETDENIKTRLRNARPMKENEIKEKGRQMIQLLAEKYNNISNKTIKSEVIINQGELENSINTVDVDDSNERLLLTGNGHIGIDKELKKVRGLCIEECKNFEENEIFSKYIARNILGSLMKGLVIPKRKIDRDIWGEGNEAYHEEYKQPKKETIKNEKKENKDKKIKKGEKRKRKA